MLSEKLLPRDYKAIDEYVGLFGRVENYNMKYVLQGWNDNKENLYHLFGDKFDIKIADEQAFEASVSEETLDKFEASAFWAFITSMNNAIGFNGGWDNFYEVFTAGACVSNRIHNDVSVHMRGIENAEKTYRLFARTEGMKFFKAFKLFLDNIKKSELPEFEKLREWLSKNEPSAEELEAMRIELSTFSQMKADNLELHLSIHPLDFMTSSDNINNWSSCMSWVHTGCYRTGTIEMMNSPVVAVAYLCNPTKPMYFGKENYEWNNKLWRAYVYICDGIVMVGKNYPSFRKDFSYTILDYFKDNGYWGEAITERSDLGHIMSKKRTAFEMEFMYNDSIYDENEGYFIADYNNDTLQEYYNVAGPVYCFSCGYLRSKSEEYDFLDEYDYDTDRPNMEFTCSDCTNYDEDMYSPKAKFRGQEYYLSSLPGSEDIIYDPISQKATLWRDMTATERENYDEVILLLTTESEIDILKEKVKEFLDTDEPRYMLNRYLFDRGVFQYDTGHTLVGEKYIHDNNLNATVYVDNKRRRQTFIIALRATFPLFNKEAVADLAKEIEDCRKNYCLHS